MLRDEGFALTLASRTAEKVEAAAAELGAHAIATDVSKPEDCARVVEEHVAREGGLDVLVNSAGIGIAGRVEDVQLKHLDRQLAINLRGLVLVTQAAIPHLRKTKGWVVNLASIAGTTAGPDSPDLRRVEGGRDLAHALLERRPRRRRCPLRSRSAPASSTRRWRIRRPLRARR